MSLNPDKCCFLVKLGLLLGHIVCSEGLLTDPRKVAAISEMPIPKNARDILVFLGAPGFYRRYVKHFAHQVEPLSYLTRGRIPYKWTPECDAAFKGLKNKMIETPILIQAGLVPGVPCTYRRLRKCYRCCTHAVQRKGHRLAYIIMLADC